MGYLEKQSPNREPGCPEHWAAEPLPWGTPGDHGWRPATGAGRAAAEGAAPAQLQHLGELPPAGTGRAGPGPGPGPVRSRELPVGLYRDTPLCLAREGRRNAAVAALPAGQREALGSCRRLAALFRCAVCEGVRTLREKGHKEPNNSLRAAPVKLLSISFAVGFA